MEQAKRALLSSKSAIDKLRDQWKTDEKQQWAVNALSGLWEAVNALTAKVDKL